jgi:hypothetical protein
VAGEPYLDTVALAVLGAARQLQVALEHLRYAVHAAIAQCATAGEHRERAWLIAVNVSVLNEPVRLALGAKPEHLQP